MNRLIIRIIPIVILSLLFISCASNVKDEKNVTGTLYISGSEPFTYLALKSNDGNYYKIECSDSLKNELWKLQGNIVELKVIELNEFEKVNIIKISDYSLKNIE